MNRLELILLRRPRVLNVLHRFYLANALSQTNDLELATLARHAAGKRMALEIGTHEGVSAACIAAALSPGGVLHCVDPWPDVNGKPNPCWRITERHLHRTRMLDRIKILRGFSSDVKDLIPHNLDFVFVDGDHSWKGIETDWAIVPPRMARDGIVCLHDTLVPPEEPWRTLDSVRFFKEVIAKDKSFQLVEQVYSLSVLRKV